VVGDSCCFVFVFFIFVVFFFLGVGVVGFVDGGKGEQLVQVHLTR